MKRGELFVELIPCFYDHKRALCVVKRRIFWKISVVVKEVGMLYFSSNKSKEKYDKIVEIVNIYNRRKSCIKK